MRYSLNELERRKKIAKIFVIFALFVLTIALIDVRLRPIAEKVSENQAQRNSISAIHKAAGEVITESGIDYNSIVTISRGENNEINSVDVDMVKVNTLKTEFINTVNQKLNSSEMNTFYIPAGTLTGSRLLSGFGPKIKVRIQNFNCVSAQIKSYFTDSGINQTLHRVVLYVEADAEIIMLGKSNDAKVSTEFLIGETLIVGEVPEAYTLIEDMTGEIAGLVNDYGAVAS